MFLYIYLHKYIIIFIKVIDTTSNILLARQAVEGTPRERSLAKGGRETTDTIISKELKVEI